MSALRPGQLLRCVQSNASCRVETLLGEGGQGEVYRVSLDGQPYALKWYNDIVLRVDRSLRRRLEVAIDHGAPSAEFLWPFELVTLADGSRLGYLMRLRHPDYLKIQSVLAEQVRPSFRALSTTALRLTNALLALHSKGLVYQDLNAGNVFFDPETGAIEICDNDNVDIDGAPSVMGGVWEFQAPEVVLKLSSLMSYMLYESNSAKVSLAKEIGYLQNYLDLEKLRFGQRLTVLFEIEGQIEEVSIPPMILILFVENSFKHGVKNNVNHIQIDISLKLEAEYLFFRIKNPMGNHPSTANAGIGLKNAKRRLELLYGENYQLDISERDNEFVVFLKIPV